MSTLFTFTFAAPLVTLTGMNALEMDPEGRIVEGVFKYRVSDYDRRTGDNKIRPKNWCRQFAREVGPSAKSVRYSSFRL